MSAFATLSFCCCCIFCMRALCSALLLAAVDAALLSLGLVIVIAGPLDWFAGCGLRAEIILQQMG